MKQEFLELIPDVSINFRYPSSPDNIPEWQTQAKVIGEAFKKAGYKVIRQYKNWQVMIYCGNARITSWRSGSIFVAAHRGFWRYPSSFWSRPRNQRENLRDLAKRFEKYLDDHKDGQLPSQKSPKRINEKLHLVKQYSPVAPSNTIVKYRVYIYSTQKELHDPEGTIKFKADIWVTQGVPTARQQRYSSKAVRTRYIPKCDVDLDKGELFKLMREGGAAVRNVIETTNSHVVIEEIASILTGTKEA